MISFGQTTTTAMWIAEWKDVFEGGGDMPVVAPFKKKAKAKLEDD